MFSRARIASLRWSRAALALYATTLAPGCSSECDRAPAAGALGVMGCPNECAGLAAPIVARAGTGDPSNPTTYQLLSDNDTVRFTTGNQGGQHVWVQLRASGVCPMATSARVRAVRADDGARIGQAISTPQRWRAVPGEAGTFASETLAVQVDDRYFCTLLDGGRLRLEYTIDDGRGTPATGSVAVTVRGWSDDSLLEQREGREQCCRDYANTSCWPDGPPRDAGADASSDASASDAPRGD